MGFAKENTVLEKRLHICPAIIDFKETRLKTLLNDSWNRRKSIEKTSKFIKRLALSKIKIYQVKSKEYFGSP